jgi:hypothetical protein
MWASKGGSRQGREGGVMGLCECTSKSITGCS